MLNSVFAAFVLAAPVPLEGADAKELRAFQGRWVGVAAEERGEAGPIKDFDHREGFVIEGTTLNIIEKGQKRERFTIKFDRSKVPAHFDITAQDQDGPQGTCHAIYKLEGNRLTICFARGFAPTAAEKRPTEFKTGPTEQRPPKGKVMYVFERAKD